EGSPAKPWRSRALLDREIFGLEARDAAHFGPVGELDLAALAADQTLTFHVCENAVDVYRRLAGDVGDLLLREGVHHVRIFDVHPDRGLAQQMGDPRGR